jgi:hypothetical protein
MNIILVILDNGLSDTEVVMKIPKIVWIPRILVFLLCIFAVLFSLDVFETPAPLGQQLLGLLMHNIPVLVVLLVLLLTWKRPLIAGVVYGIVTIVILALLAFYMRDYFWIDFAAFGVPMIVITVLFLIVHMKMVKANSSVVP